MSRDVSTAFNTAATSSTVGAAFLASLDFSSGTVRVWSGVGTLSWDGQSWAGVGDLGSVSAIQEQPGAVATGLTLGLSFNDSSILTSILSEDYQGRSVGVWLALFDSDNAIIVDPFEYFGGLMDYAEVKRSNGAASISIYCESWMRVLERKNSRRRTNQDQQSRFAGDLGFEYNSEIQDVPVNWGQADAQQTKNSRQALRKLK